MDSLAISPGQEFNVLSSKLQPWTGWLASLVIDESGNHAGSDGTSKSISNPVDLQLLLALRSKASIIVTTGKTARLEKYRSSRFAPIAVLTRQPNSVTATNNLENEGGKGFFALSTPGAQIDFLEVTEKLSGLGHESFLFEGGPSSLETLATSELPLQIVLSITNVVSSSSTNPAGLLGRVLSNAHQFQLIEAFGVANNLVTRWVKPRS